MGWMEDEALAGEGAWRACRTCLVVGGGAGKGRKCQWKSHVIRRDDTHIKDAVEIDCEIAIPLVVTGKDAVADWAREG